MAIGIADTRGRKRGLGVGIGDDAEAGRHGVGIDCIIHIALDGDLKML